MALIAQSNEMLAHLNLFKVWVPLRTTKPNTTNVLWKYKALTSSTTGPVGHIYPPWHVYKVGSVPFLDKSGINSLTHDGWKGWLAMAGKSNQEIGIGCKRLLLQLRYTYPCYRFKNRKCGILRYGGKPADIITKSELLRITPETSSNEYLEIGIWTMSFYQKSSVYFGKK